MIRLVLCISVVTTMAACTDNSEVKLIASGRALLAKQDYAGAVIQFKNALDKNPRSAAARLALGNALLAAGDPVTAQIELRRAQEELGSDDEVVPSLARALLATGESGKLTGQYSATTLGTASANADLKTSLGAAYAAQGDLGLARQTAAAALLAQPGYAAAAVLLARLDTAENDWAGALRQLDEVLVREPNHLDAGLVKGQVLLLGMKTPDAALDFLRRVRTANPNSVEARLSVLDILIQQDKRAEARAELEQLQKLAPRHPHTLFMQAQFACDDKDYKVCREISQKLLAAMPNNVRVLLLAGATELATRNYTLAESLLSRAVKNAPQSLIAKHLLAQTLLRNSLPEKVIELLQPVLDSDRIDATSLGLIGQAHLQLGDSKRSEEAFQRASKLAPDDPRTRTSLALAQLERGESTLAIKQLEAIAKSNSGTEADLVLISARLRQNDLQGALQAIDALEKKLPEQAYPLALRGRVLGQMGDMAAAKASFEKALLKQATHFPAVDGLAAMDLNAGKPEAARQRFLALLKTEPKSFQAKLALAELESRQGAPDAVVVAHLKEAVRLDQSQRAPHMALIERLLASGDIAGALAAVQEASATLPNDLVIMDALGRAQMAAESSQQAVSTFKKLVALQPKKALPALRLADAYLANQDTASAATALRQALAIEPGNLMALRGQALLAVLNKQPQEGIAIARSMQQRLPKDAVGFALEGELQANQKNWGPAATAYAAALQRSKSTDYAARLHRCLRDSGKHTEADRVATDWLKDNPKDAVFLYYLGDAASSLKDWAMAEAHYRAVLALQPRHAVAMNNVAWLLVTQGKPGATALAEQANALLPERATLLDTLALALEADNQLPKAVQVQQRAVALEPKNPALRLRLAKLFIKQDKKSDARQELESLAKLNRDSATQAEVARLLKAL